MLALRGGPDLVARWAQLGSVMEVVTGVAVAGVATGLTVYVARTPRQERQADLLLEARRLALLVALCVAAAAAAALWPWKETVLGAGTNGPLLLLAAAGGWLATGAALVNAYWLGRQERGRMLVLAAGGAAFSLGAGWLAPDSALLPLLLCAQALPGALVFLFRDGRRPPRFRQRSHPLHRYVVPGLAIGILSPASFLAARSIVGESLSWQEAGELQALWRLSDWVCAFAAGVLSLHYLPRFAALRGTPRFAAELRHAFAATMLPSAAAFLAVFATREPLLTALYGPAFVPSAQTAGLVFAGSLLRIASWIPLFALYAMRSTRTIAVAELLSVPLFAGLVALAGEGLTLELAAASWAAAYAAYFAFNAWAARSAIRRARS